MARDRLYPPSVTPGIPRLGTKPEGWTATTFGEVLEVVHRAAKIHNDQAYQLVTAKRNRGGIVAREVLRGTKILTKTQFLVEKDDFLISKRQIIHGACGIVPAELHGALVSGEYTVLRVRPGLQLQYLGYLTNTVYFQQTCFQASVGVDVEKMIFDVDRWLKNKLYLPDIVEQEAIVSRLKVWDDAIRITRRLMAGKQKLKQTLLYELLMGKVRYPPFCTNERIKSSKYGNIPLDWSIVTIADVAAINAEAISGSDNRSQHYRYVDLAAVKEGRVALPEVTKPVRDLPSRARRIAHKYDVLMSTVRPNLLGYAICRFDTQSYLFSTGFAVLTPKHKYDAEFIYQCLFSHTVQNQISRLLAGSNYPALNEADVAKLELAWPANDRERELIGNTLSMVDKEIDQLGQYEVALLVQRKGLIRDLLVGEVRIKV